MKKRHRICVAADSRYIQKQLKNKEENTTNTQNENENEKGKEKKFV